MRLTRSSVLMINVVVALLGVIIVLISVDITTAVLRILCEAIGTGLIATGAVNFLDRLLAQEGKEARPPIDMVATSRTALPADVHNRKYRVSKVDIVGVTLIDCLKQIVNDPSQTMVNRVLFHRVRLRLLFVHPKASILRQRALEDGISEEKLTQRQRESVELSIQFYKQLKERYEEAVRSGQMDCRAVGEVVIKLIDFCPYITIDRADDEIYWGLYTSDTPGMNLPVFAVTREQNFVLFDQLRKHFYALLEKDLSPGDHVLVRMTIGEPPILNYALAKDVLGEERLRMLLT